MLWFNRKSKNRRLNSGYVLDVKLRSGQVRASRLRLVAFGSGALIGTALVLFVLWQAGLWALNKLVYENSAFGIEQIEVQTDGVITADQLRRWADVRSGQNLLALDLARVKRNLEMVPLIASVSVERVLPRTLRLRVTEREAIAQVNVTRVRPGGGLEASVFHLDPDGWVMVPLDPRQRTVPLVQTNDTLPLLKGLNMTELQPGRCVESPQTQAALRLISEFACSPMAGMVDLKSIDVSAPQVLVVSTAQGSEVTFALGDLERQLRRWRDIYDRGRRNNRNIATLDLAVSNNIPASWLEASISPPPAKAPKVLRTKRKNV
jgi:cell division protein FtsQ